MLTKKQKDLLLFIHSHMQHDDVAPSFEEMKDALGLKSKSGIHRLITALVERGYLERLPHRARALEVKKLPPGLEKPHPANQSSPRDVPALAHLAPVEIPLYGKIAAGTPIEAIAHEGESVMVPPGMTGAGEHYALTVEGDSMIKAGINDSDIVIIKRCTTAESGAIIVALIDGEEATLKRLRYAGTKIVLEPENDSYEPRILEPARVQIQGRLVSLMRQYH